MTTNRKPRGVSSRAKAGTGTSRTASSARSQTKESPQSVPEVESLPEEILEVEVVAEPEVISEEAATAIEVEATAQPTIAPSESSQSEAIEPEAVEPEVVEPEVFQPEVSAVSEPEAPSDKSKVSNPTSVQLPQGEKTMTQETENSAPLAAPQKQATGSGLVGSPVMPSEVTFVGTIASAGERPIGAATMSVFATYLNGRPIEASSVKLFELLPGDRPVFANEIAYLEGPVPGRPIMVSPGGLITAPQMMMSRPIFSNNIVDPEPAALMGYLD